MYVTFEINFRNGECIIGCLDLGRIKEGQERMVTETQHWDPCDQGTVQYLGCGGSFRNVHR